MSLENKPSPRGVAEVLKNLEEANDLSAELARLGPELKRIEDRVGEINRRLLTLRRELNEKMGAMDVDESGNFGWEDRHAWFLQELLRQARAARPVAEGARPEVRP